MFKEEYFVYQKINGSVYYYTGTTLFGTSGWVQARKDAWYIEGEELAKSLANRHKCAYRKCTIKDLHKRYT